jgi:hypothetical protein
MPRGLRQVPRAAVWVNTSLSGLRQRSMHVASVRKRCGLVDSRTDQWMAKNDSRKHFQQVISFNRGSCGLVDSELLGGAPHKNRIARRLGSRDEE